MCVLEMGKGRERERQRREVAGERRRRGGGGGAAPIQRRSCLEPNPSFLLAGG